MIAERTQHFSGRGWVFERINQWLADPNGGRVFLLAGGPGTGKTAIAARLAQVSEGSAKLPATCDRLQGGFLTYMHFCQASLESTLSPIRFVQALSEALANAFPAFREALEQQGSDQVVLSPVVNTGAVAAGGKVTGVEYNVETVEIQINSDDARSMFDVAVRGPAAGSRTGASRSGRGRADRFPRRGADVQPGAQHRPPDAAGERLPSERPLHPDGPIQQRTRDGAHR